MFVSIDPGKETGLTLWDDNCEWVETKTIKYDSAIDYLKQLELFKKKADFAIIERFDRFGKVHRYHAEAVVTQVKLCTEVFADHISINARQWNRNSLKKDFKKALVSEIFGKNGFNDHEIDSILIGNYCLTEATHATYINTFDIKPYQILKMLATRVRKWPTAKGKSLYQLIRENF